jgi:hypothetical protein
MEAYKRWFRHFAVLFSIGVLITFYAGVVESLGAPAPLKRKEAKAQPHPAWLWGRHHLQWGYPANVWTVYLEQNGSMTLASPDTGNVWVGTWRYEGEKLHVKEWQYQSDKDADRVPNFSYSMAFEGTLWRHTEWKSILLYRDAKVTD